MLGIGKKISGIVLGLTVALSSILATTVAMPVKTHAMTSSDFLKTNGKTIRNNSGTGSVITLRGTNAGGWLVLENWMCPTDAKDDVTQNSVFTSRFGAATKDSLIKTYQDNWWKATDFDNCKNLGMNVLRLPFTYMNLLDSNGNLRSDAWTRLDWFVSNCNSRGMYVILDLHGAPGSQNGADHSGDTRGANLWNSTANMDKTVWIWQQIATRYKGNAAVAAYDLLNEPTGATGTTQWNFYDRLYKAIRAIDPDHIIMMEAVWEPADLPNPAQYGWTNVVYQYHNYCWNADNDYNTQKAFTDSKVSKVNAANYNVPTFIGEFMGFANMSSWDYILKTYNQQGWSWTTWAYKATGTNNNWGLYNGNPSKVYINTDSSSTIQSKWSTVGAFTQNTTLCNVFSTYAKATPTPTPVPGSYSSIKAGANNNYVCADNYGNNPLVANRTTVSDWEKFQVINNSDGTISLLSKANNMYVCADINQSAKLIARSATIGTWEKFKKVTQADGTVALQAMANNLYVGCDLNNGAVLYANKAAVGGAWEVFVIAAAP